MRQVIHERFSGATVTYGNGGGERQRPKICMNCEISFTDDHIAHGFIFMDDDIIFWYCTPCAEALIALTALA